MESDQLGRAMGRYIAPGMVKTVGDELSPEDPRLAILFNWIDQWWHRNEPDRRVWFYEDLRQRYPEFDRWLRLRWGESVD